MPGTGPRRPTRASTSSCRARRRRELVTAVPVNQASRPIAARLKHGAGGARQGPARRRVPRTSRQQAIPEARPVAQDPQARDGQQHPGQQCRGAIVMVRPARLRYQAVGTLGLTAPVSECRYAVFSRTRLGRTVVRRPHNISLPSLPGIARRARRPPQARPSMSVGRICASLAHAVATTAIMSATAISGRRKIVASAITSNPTSTMIQAARNSAR
jgi:hypothetical protein